MCKYCELKPGVPGEETNECVSIDSIREGHMLFDLIINRYVDRDANHHIAELIMEHAVDLGRENYTVQEKHISISYCPFCGEKL